MRRTRLPRLVVAWFTLTALVACGAPWPDPHTEVTDATAIELHRLVNEARASARSCGAHGWFDAAQPLALDPRLTRAAQLHSEDMRDTGTMSHTGSDGSSPAQRIDRQGYAWGSAGENVAWGDPTPEAVMAGWLGSDGHCANLMHEGFRDLGAGEAGAFWTLVFARPR
ncbi:MAG: CAP domain-containing protein [Trueperaceae bacterium]